MTALKFSRQRESIKAYLASSKEHPTADTVYTHVREQYPNISLGTVYRNLNLLVEQGEAIKVVCGDGYDHFDATCTPHYHFVCKECKRVLDLDLPNIDHINTLAQANFNGQIENHSVYFTGICPECLNNESKDKN
ncbi:MAG: transcriptional repressor [Clostridiales bacterium]|nr:transcriptional repressor [Clostridiales bacterium]